MSLKSLFALLATLFLVSCQAYRSAPTSEISFTRDDLNAKGVVLAPLSVPEAKLNPGVSELAAYDAILSNTLKSKWPKAPLLSSSEIAETLGAESVESWRTQLGAEDMADASPSSHAVLSRLTAMGRSYPKQVLLPTLLQNSVSCGQKEPLSTTLSPDPHGVRNYCQRVVKMRFRIMAVDSSELLWNGLVYATQEAIADIPAEDAVEKGGSAPREEPEAPSTQKLIRDCFLNFAKQFSERY